MTPIYAQWYPRQVPTTQDLRDIYFSDTTNGWVTCSDGIFRTTNGGYTWKQQFFGRAGYIAGISARECWTANLRDTLLHTYSGGEIWERISVGRYFDLDSVRRITRLYFFDSLRGWASAIGWKGTDSDILKFVKTTDGGKTWQQDSLSNHGVYAFYPFIQFVDHDYGWVAGYNILRTTDGGLKWDSISNAIFTAVLDMQFLTREIGWITQDGPIAITSVWKTTDGGYTWNFQKDFQCASPTTVVGFADSLNGWVVTFSCLNWLEIWHTSDGGLTWDFSDVDSSFSPEQIFVVDQLHVWIAGSQGRILHTTNGGVTIVQSDHHPLPSRFSLYQNYPNPTNPYTYIRYHLPEEGLVTLKIFDVLGKEVKSLVDGVSEEAGIRYAFWDGRNSKGIEVTSGIHFYRLVVTRKNGEIFTSTRKMIIVR